MQRVAVCRTYKSKSKNSNIMQSLSKPESIRHGAAKRTADHPIRSRQLLDHGLHHADGDAKFLQRKGDNLNQEHFDSDIASWLSSPAASSWIHFLRDYQKIDMYKDTDYDGQLALLDLIKGSVINVSSIGMGKFLGLLDSEIEFVTYQKISIEKEKRDKLMQRMDEKKLFMLDEELKIDKWRLEAKNKKTRNEIILIGNFKKELAMFMIENEFSAAKFRQGYYFQDESSDSYNKIPGEKTIPTIFKNHFDSTRTKQSGYLKSDIKLTKKEIVRLDPLFPDMSLKNRLNALQPEPKENPKYDFLSRINPIYKLLPSDKTRQNRKDEQYLKFKKIQEEFERAEKYRK